ncbi:hypothetical protein [Pseudoblastomonas halimionae]|uniref:Uncharacterized protein n=1 Tax=Alteriqipengyuania halimionae TaxID=1926630 RepID=A0A6I4UA71_9SPHN|nr:hypothetical protein [Alteriqipengyuania halimionae]MXP11177.1 hypothetical protein [Alteriqipengyuania halimionae]
MKWIMQFGRDAIGSFGDGLRAMKGLPWLFAAIVLWEFAQHIVEVRIGMFESVEQARAVGGDALRMVFGWIKMLSVYLGGFFVIRYLALRNDGLALAPVGTALGRYAPYLVYSLILFAAIFYTRAFAPAAHVDTIRAVVGLSQVLVEPLLMAWVVATATDGAIGNPLSSARRTGWLYLYALPLFLLVRIPINLLHGALNSEAIGRSQGVLWSMLAVDAVVVGILIAVVPAISVRVARRIREKQANVTTQHAATSVPA